MCNRYRSCLFIIPFFFTLQSEAQEPVGMFTNVDTIPVCIKYQLSKELARLAVDGNEAAYVKMFDSHKNEGNCTMLAPSTALIVVKSMPDYNLVEMVGPGSLTFYGPGMMLEPLPK